MSILYDERHDHISHFGVKGMKWGIRKAVYKQQKSGQAEAKAEAAAYRAAAKTHLKGGAAANTKEHRKILEDAAWDVADFDGRAERTLRGAAWDIRKGNEQYNSRESVAKALNKSAKIMDSDEKMMRTAAKNNKAKMDQLAADIKRDKSDPDYQERRNRNIMLGTTIVTSMVTAAAVHVVNKRLKSNAADSFGRSMAARGMSPENVNFITDSLKSAR